MLLRFYMICCLFQCYFSRLYSQYEYAQVVLRKEESQQELKSLAAQVEETNLTKDQTIRHQTAAIAALNRELKDFGFLFSNSCLNMFYAFFVHF